MCSNAALRRAFAGGQTRPANGQEGAGKEQCDAERCRALLGWLAAPQAACQWLLHIVHMRRTGV